MTVSTSGYTLGANLPLHYARILWDMASGTLTSAGDTGSPTLAGNDYTHQRWASTRDLSTEVDWLQLTGAATFDIDTVFIAAHNLDLIGATFTIETAPETAATFNWTTRATVTPTAPGPIAIMFTDGSGDPVTVGAVRIHIDTGDADDAPRIGIFRAGTALQMYRPFGETHPIGLRTEKVLRHLDSETGQPLVRAVERRRKSANVGWSFLPLDWYQANFQPFAETLPERPFAFIQNAVSMPESVAWAWTNDDPMPQISGGRKWVDISLSLMGYDG